METTEKKEAVKTPARANGNALSIDSLVNALDSAEVGKEIQTKYLSFDDTKGIPMGQQVKLVLVEITEINGMGEKSDTMVPAVKIYAKDTETGVAQEYINADAVLVSFAKRNKLPMPVAVTWKGWVKGGKGEYREFQFNDIPVRFAK